MKRCLSCDARYSSLIHNCPGCGFAPVHVAGFDSYAPNFAHEGGGFKSNYFSDLKWTPKTGQQFNWDTVTINGVNHDRYKKAQRSPSGVQGQGGA